MMQYITSVQLFPGALSDGAAALLKEIYQAVTWIPYWRDMTKAQIEAFDELYPGRYIECTAFGGYRVKGVDPLAAMRQHTAQWHKACLVRRSFVSLGVAEGNIKSVRPSPNGFAASEYRWCVTLYHAVSLSALQVNWTPGLSGAVWNGNVCFVLVGKVG